MEQEVLEEAVPKKQARKRAKRALAPDEPSVADTADVGEAPDAAANEKPGKTGSVLHSGHRQRMRERFRANGLDGFAPHEVLELLLFFSRARGDTNPLAHTLLDTFGSLRGVLEAETEQLMAVKGMGEESATLISLMLPVFRRYSASVCEARPSIGSRSEAESYCAALLAGHRTEHFYAICLGADNRLLGQRLIAEGTLTEVAAYPRLVAEAVLNHNAHSVVLCHNHPSGLCVPSPDDVASTRRLMMLLAGLGVTLLDHIIVAGDRTYSMVQHGDIQLQLWVEGSPAKLTPEEGGSVIPGRKRTKGKSK